MAPGSRRGSLWPWFTGLVGSEAAVAKVETRLIEARAGLLPAPFRIEGEVARPNVSGILAAWRPFTLAPDLRCGALTRCKKPAFLSTNLCPGRPFWRPPGSPPASGVLPALNAWSTGVAWAPGAPYALPSAVATLKTSAAAPARQSQVLADVLGPASGGVAPSAPRLGEGAPSPPLSSASTPATRPSGADGTGGSAAAEAAASASAVGLTDAPANQDTVATEVVGSAAAAVATAPTTGLHRAKKSAKAVIGRAKASAPAASAPGRSRQGRSAKRLHLGSGPASKNASPGTGGRRSASVAAAAASEANPQDWLAKLQCDPKGFVTKLEQILVARYSDSGVTAVVKRLAALALLRTAGHDDRTIKAYASRSIGGLLSKINQQLSALGLICPHNPGDLLALLQEDPLFLVSESPRGSAQARVTLRLGVAHQLHSLDLRLSDLNSALQSRGPPAGAKPRPGASATAAAAAAATGTDLVPIPLIPPYGLGPLLLAVERRYPPERSVEDWVRHCVGCLLLRAASCGEEATTLAAIAAHVQHAWVKRSTSPHRAGVRPSWAARDPPAVELISCILQDDPAFAVDPRHPHQLGLRVSVLDPQAFSVTAAEAAARAAGVSRVPAADAAETAEAAETETEAPPWQDGAAVGRAVPEVSALSGGSALPGVQQTGGSDVSLEVDGLGRASAFPPAPPPPASPLSKVQRLLRALPPAPPPSLAVLFPGVDLRYVPDRSPEDWVRNRAVRTLLAARGIEDAQLRQDVACLENMVTILSRSWSARRLHLGERFPLASPERVETLFADDPAFVLKSGSPAGAPSSLELDLGALWRLCCPVTDEAPAPEWLRNEAAIRVLQRGRVYASREGFELLRRQLNALGASKGISLEDEARLRELLGCDPRFEPLLLYAGAQTTVGLNLEVLNPFLQDSVSFEQLSGQRARSPDSGSTEREPRGAVDAPGGPTGAPATAAEVVPVTREALPAVAQIGDLASAINVRYPHRRAPSNWLLSRAGLFLLRRIGAGKAEPCELSAIGEYLRDVREARAQRTDTMPALDGADLLEALASDPLFVVAGDPPAPDLLLGPSQRLRPQSQSQSQPQPQPQPQSGVDRPQQPLCAAVPAAISGAATDTAAAGTPRLHPGTGDDASATVALGPTDLAKPEPSAAEHQPRGHAAAAVPAGNDDGGGGGTAMRPCDPEEAVMRMLGRWGTGGSAAAARPAGSLEDSAVTLDRELDAALSPGLLRGGVGHAVRELSGAEDTAMCPASSEGDRAGWGEEAGWAPEETPGPAGTPLWAAEQAPSDAQEGCLRAIGDEVAGLGSVLTPGALAPPPPAGVEPPTGGTERLSLAMAQLVKAQAASRGAGSPGSRDPAGRPDPIQDMKLTASGDSPSVQPPAWAPTTIPTTAATASRVPYSPVPRRAAPTGPPRTVTPSPDPTTRSSIVQQVSRHAAAVYPPHSGPFAWLKYYLATFIAEEGRPLHAAAPAVADMPPPNPNAPTALGKAQAQARTLAAATPAVRSADVDGESPAGSNEGGRGRGQGGLGTNGAGAGWAKGSSEGSLVRPAAAVAGGVGVTSLQMSAPRAARFLRAAWELYVGQFKDRAEVLHVTRSSASVVKLEELTEADPRFMLRPRAPDAMLARGMGPGASRGEDVVLDLEQLAREAAAVEAGAPPPDPSPPCVLQPHRDIAPLTPEQVAAVLLGLPLDRLQSLITARVEAREGGAADSATPEAADPITLASRARHNALMELLEEAAQPRSGEASVVRWPTRGTACGAGAGGRRRWAQSRALMAVEHLEVRRMLPPVGLWEDLCKELQGEADGAEQQGLLSALEVDQGLLRGQVAAAGVAEGDEAAASVWPGEGGPISGLGAVPEDQGTAAESDEDASQPVADPGLHSERSQEVAPAVTAASASASASAWPTTSATDPAYAAAPGQSSEVPLLSQQSGPTHRSSEYPDEAQRVQPQRLQRSHLPVVLLSSPGDPGLETMVQHLRQCSHVALDCEMYDASVSGGGGGWSGGSGLMSYVALVQVLAPAVGSFCRTVYLVDVQGAHGIRERFALMRALQPVLSDAGVVKVLHGADGDVNALRAHYGIQVAPIVDIQQVYGIVALAWAGAPYICTRQLRTLRRTGLERVMAAMDLGLTHKAAFKDRYAREPFLWRRRPLTPEMWEYAVQDVVFLLDAYRALLRHLLGHPAARPAFLLDPDRHREVLRVPPVFRVAPRERLWELVRPPGRAVASMTRPDMPAASLASEIKPEGQIDSDAGGGEGGMGGSGVEGR